MSSSPAPGRRPPSSATPGRRIMVGAVDSYRAQVTRRPGGRGRRACARRWTRSANTTLATASSTCGATSSGARWSCGRPRAADAAVDRGARAAHATRTCRSTCGSTWSRTPTFTWMLTGQWARAPGRSSRSRRRGGRTTSAPATLTSTLLDLLQRGDRRHAALARHLGRAGARRGRTGLQVRELLVAWRAARRATWPRMRGTIRRRCGPATAMLARRRPAVAHGRARRTRRGRRRAGGPRDRRSTATAAGAPRRRSTDGCAAVPSLRPARRGLAPRPRRPARPLPRPRRPPGAAGCPRGLGTDRARPGRGCHAPVTGGAGGGPRRPATLPGATSRPDERSPSGSTPRPCWRVPTRWRRGGRSARASVVRTGC